MLKSITKTTMRVVAHKTGPVGYLLYKASQAYVKSYKNLNYDMNTNGEFLILDRLATLGIKTVFDVGANKGEYAQECLLRFPEATVHSFEIVPATFQKLMTNPALAKRVKINNVGLSNFAGPVEINYNQGDDGISSLIAGSSIHQGNWRRIPVRVITGDAYCRDNNVTSIDLLKIDVEGAEHLVLEGFRETLGRGIVSAIQFEFGMANIYSKFLLNDFWSLLTEYGFVLGPLMPTGVDFKDYNPRDEDFQGAPNFIAVQRNRPDMIAAVRRT